MTVPVLGKIAAGLPIPTPPEVLPEGYEEVEVTEDQTKGRTNAFALKVEGTSMIDALINDGDIVILEPTQSCDDGDMVAVWLKAENETTLKKFFHEGDRIRLWVDGQATVDYTEADKAIEKDGIIALQVHGGAKTIARYKDIAIVELPAK